MLFNQSGEPTFRRPLILAPMAGYTDYAFRLLCKHMGADYLVSEMVSAKAICYKDKKTKILTRITPQEMPMAIQLFGSDPEFVSKAAAIITESYGTDSTAISAIDINMGCPVNKIVSNGEGSALMKNPLLAGKIISETVKATPLPVTVKIRTGWDADSINAPEFAKIAQESGAAAVCVHGRTRAQMYSDKAEYGVIAQVKRALRIPVIGNGDIYSAADADRMTRETGCDALMIGRGAIGNPWIFQEIRAMQEGKPFTFPTIADRVSTALEHVNAMIDDKGPAAIKEARKHLAFYVKGYPGAAAARARVNSAESVDEIHDIMMSLIH